MTFQPLVSIITANYNKARFILETAHSVLNQSYQNWEWLIIDDNSTDNSVQIIKQVAQDKRIQFFQNTENKGANFCRNYGLQKAKGEYVVFLDTDDLLDKICLESRIKKANEKPDGNLFVFAMGVFKKEIGDDSRKWLPNSKKPLQDFLQHKLPWQTMQPLWKRYFLLELKGFDETFERLQDVELHTRALLHQSVKVYQFSGITDCHYRIDEERKNFNAFHFLQRATKSSVMYCNKFVAQITDKQKSLLLGTILAFYFQVIYALKHKKIDFVKFRELEEILFLSIIYKQANENKRFIFKVYYLYNRFLPRVPGINKILTYFTTR